MDGEGGPKAATLGVKGTADSDTDQVTTEDDLLSTNPPCSGHYRSSAVSTSTT